MIRPPLRPGVVTVTLNAAIDQTLDCPGFTPGAVNRVLSETRTAGGKGVNVAALLAASGDGPITATGFLGHENDAAFTGLFHERGIADRCIRLPGAVRTNVKLVDRTTGAVTDINLPGLTVPPDALSRLSAAVEELAAEAGCVVMAGSLPAGVPANVYGALVPRVQAAGAFVAVDTSGPPLAHALAARPGMVKPNVHELSEHLGRPLPDTAAVVAAATDLHRTGITLVVVSLGAGGAVFVGAEGALKATPPAVEVASTVGAGDAMVAGVLSAWCRGAGLEDCARRGTAFAAGTLAVLGPSLPPPARLDELARATAIHWLTAAG